MTTTTSRRDEHDERDEGDAGRLADVQVPVRLRLSALWTTVMFLYVYVDMFHLYKPGTIDDILVGRVWKFDISQAWALGAMILMAIPSLMVFLSLALPARVSRWANVVVASLFVPVSAGNAVGEAWTFYWFGAAVEVLLLVLIVRYAWAWPRQTARRAGQGSPMDSVTSA